jgi:ATP/maltotriose-dependent transcriptional regulator MalT
MSRALIRAAVAVQRAMAEHDRLAMPFERARTQLLAGQVQRRSRQKQVADSTLGLVLSSFEQLGVSRRADRARAELARVKVGTQCGVGLTASERRAAELAAAGMTNREIAAALFVTAKTVEAGYIASWASATVPNRLAYQRASRLARNVGISPIT